MPQWNYSSTEYELAASLLVKFHVYLQLFVYYKDDWCELFLLKNEGCTTDSHIFHQDISHLKKQMKLYQMEKQWCNSIKSVK